jgi:hypothetical protein
MKGAWGCLAFALTVNISAQSATTPGTAQAPSPGGVATQPAQPTPSPQPAPPAPARLTPEQHLANAEKALAGVSERSASGDMQKTIAQLRTDFMTMTSAYRESIAKSKPWVSSIYAVERDLVLLVGGGGPDADAPDKDNKDKKSIPGLSAQVSDPMTRAALEAFRTHVELFFDAATATPASISQPVAEGGTR